MVPPSRRQILSVLSAGIGIIFAGCTSDTEPATDDTEDKSPADETGPIPEFPADTASDACPPFDEADQVVCYDAVDPESIPLALIPETQSVQPDQPTDFTLRNRSDQQFNTNVHHWQLYKQVDGEWYYIMPQSWIEPMTPLEAGEEHTWTATIETGRVSDGDRIEEVVFNEPLTTAGLGGGHYAFGIDGWFTNGSTEESIALATGFELETDPLKLAPTSDISVIKRDGDTLIARSTSDEEENGSSHSDEFILERIENPDTTPKQVIVEQVVRDQQLRNAMALSQEHDAARVRIEAFSRYSPSLRIDDIQSFVFQGSYYRVEINEESS